MLWEGRSDAWVMGVGVHTLDLGPRRQYHRMFVAHMNHVVADTPVVDGTKPLADAASQNTDLSYSASSNCYMLSTTPSSLAFARTAADTLNYFVKRRMEGTLVSATAASRSGVNSAHFEADPSYVVEDRLAYEHIAGAVDGAEVDKVPNQQISMTTLGDTQWGNLLHSHLQASKVHPHIHDPTMNWNDVRHRHRDAWQ
jgi:hypothetical protein